MNTMIKFVILSLVFAIINGGIAKGQADPEGDWDSMWIEVVDYMPDSVLCEVRITTDNPVPNCIMGIGLPFVISVSNNVPFQLDTTTQRTFKGSVVEHWSQRAAVTDSTGGPGGKNPTISPVKIVIGAVDIAFTCIRADTGILLATFKLRTYASCNVTIDTTHTGTLPSPTFTTTYAVDYIPRWVPTPPFIFLDVKDVQKGTTAIPEQFGLDQNFPNPFNATTVIQFAVKQSSHVMLEIFNVLGQRVNTLVDEELTAGYKQILWDGTDHRGISVASGIYFYRIKAGNLFTEMKKMVLLK